MKPKQSHKNIKFSCLAAFLLSIGSSSAFGQLFSTDQNPLRVKWRQISNGGFSILYPTELEKEAQRMANTVGYIYPYVAQGLQGQKTSLPIVLQNRGIPANGFVQLAPKKSEFYSTPPQQFDSQDWLNNLAVHELRHVAQYDKFTGGRKLFLSQEIYFAYMGISTPTWFFEGDAVGTETALTHAGRGRQPAWIMPYRTSLLSGKNFSYSKAYFGSAKDLTPGYYQLGYLLSSQLRKDFGRGIIDSLFTDLRKRPARLYPFAQSLRKFTGYNTRQFYLATAQQLKAQWQAQDQQYQTENYTSLNPPAKYATSYYLPVALNATQVLSLKHGKSISPSLVLSQPGQSEKLLLRIGYQEQPWFSYANNVVVWDEVHYDPRYKQRSYSVICRYDLQSKTRRQLTFKTRLFSPALSADGKKMVAIAVDLANNSNLVSLDPHSGAILHSYPNPGNLILQTPSLNADGSAMAWISVSEKGKALWTMQQDAAPSQLISETNQQLGRPVFIGQMIAFNAHLSGVDNVYGIDPSKKEIVALTAAKYGAFNASPGFDQRSILFNDYQLQGYNMASTPIAPKPVQPNHFVYFGAAATQQENTGNVFENVPDSVFQSKPYRPLAHAFNFHSLSPNIDEDDQPGIRLKSTDLLNTLDFFAGLSYNTDLNQLAYQAGFAYKSLYPVLSGSYTNRPRTAFYQSGKQVQQANWREDYLKLKASLPLSFNRYQHNYGLTAEVGTSYTLRHFGPAEQALFSSRLKFPLQYGLAFSHSVRPAERDLAPRWSQYLSLSYFNQPFDPARKGRLLAFQSILYFPGLAKNHALMASFNFQQASGVLSANTEISTVYGYGQIKAKTGLRNTLLFNYRFPIAFPDAELGSLAYIRNLRGGLFAHYENIGHQTNLGQPKTFGLELRSTMNLLRYQPLVDVGTRLIFVNKMYHQKPILAFVFNYSF